MFASSWLSLYFGVVLKMGDNHLDVRGAICCLSLSLLSFSRFLLSFFLSFFFIPYDYGHDYDSD